MFNGQVLKELRLLNGMSRAELAEQMSLTEQAVWQFESNVTSPKIAVKLKLARYFQVDIDYFNQEEDVSNFDLSGIAFRNADLTTKKKISIQTVYLNKIDKFISYLESFVIIPNTTIHQVSQYTNEAFNSGTSIEELAAYARRMFKVADDNSDLLYKLEKSGIYIAERLINGQADAYSAWSKQDRPFIILGINKSAVRRNFDLAHELGHLLLHKMKDKEEDTDILEQQANRFASFFLLPEEAFLRDFEQLVGKRVSNPDYYIELKKKYYVSIQDLEYRAYKLGLLTPQQNSYFYRQISKKDYKVMEPLDKDLPIKQPSKVRSILDVILSNNLTTVSAITSQQKVHLNYISQLFSFAPSFFDKYQNKELADFDNIIPLENYRLGQ